MTLSLVTTAPITTADFSNEICEHLLEYLPALEIIRRSYDTAEAIKAAKLIAEIQYTVKSMKLGVVVPNFDLLRDRYQCCTASDIARLMVDEYRQM